MKLYLGKLFHVETGAIRDVRVEAADELMAEQKVKEQKVQGKEVFIKAYFNKAVLPVSRAG